MDKILDEDAMRLTAVRSLRLLSSSRGESVAWHKLQHGWSGTTSPFLYSHALQATTGRLCGHHQQSTTEQL